MAYSRNCIKKNISNMSFTSKENLFKRKRGHNRMLYIFNSSSTIINRTITSHKFCNLMLIFGKIKLIENCKILRSFSNIMLLLS